MFDRQEDAEAGALAGVALDLEAASLVVDHPVGDAQTQAGAVADALGREERVEDLRQDLVGDAAAVVGDLDDDLAVAGRRW